MANLICTYNVTTTTEATKICNQRIYFSDILYNGESIGVVNDYTFPSIGEHTLEFVLKNDTYINPNAFEGCTNLTSVVIPNSVTSIGNWVFHSCGLTGELVIPNSVTTIGDGAFSRCTGLTGELVIPNSVTTINYHAFADCTGLTSIEIPNSVRTIGESAFADCTGLTGELVIPNSITIISESAFANCRGLTSIEIPNSVRTIGESAFADCTGLTYLIIPNSVRTIGESAFYGCTGLNEIICYAKTAPTIGALTFNVNTTGGTLYYPTGSDYSTWLIYDDDNPDKYLNLGFHFWNGVEFDVDNPPTPEPPVDPDEPTYPDGEVYEPTEINFVIDYTGQTITYTMNVSNIQYYQYWGMEEWVKVTNQNNRFVIEVSPNEGESRTSGFYIDFIDYNGNVFHHVAIITQEGKPEEEPDEPDVPPTPDNPEGEIVTPNQTKTISSSGATFRYNIEANNMQGLGKYYPSDIDWITITYIDDYNFNITVDENEGDERSETIYFVYYDNNGDAFEHELTISQDGKAVEPDEPDVPPTPPTPDEPDEPDEPVEKTPSVVVSKNNINLDNVGDTTIIQVTYINVDEIVPPEVPDGFTIEEIERIESENGIQVKYRVTRISPKRQNAQINFKGNSSGGKTATSSNVNLRGEPVPATINITSIWPKKDDYFLIEDKQDCHIDFTISNFNTPYTMTYSIKDTNGAVYLRNSKESITDPNLYLTYDFKSLPNNTNNPFTGSIDFTYTDELTNYNVSIPFYVKCANEGEVKVNVISYNFDKDGNRLDTNKDKFIDVHYIKIASINEPVVDADWFHLEDGVRSDYKDWVNGEYVVVGDSYRHNFTIDANSGSARKGTITFSGKGIDGKDYSFVLDVNQEGSDTVKPIDIGFIELQQLSVVLNADGDAQTFQVKYYDAITIYEPELAGTWATITEVSRTEPVPDTAWNGEECESVIVTYQVTGQPTDSGRQMKVKFKSDINNNDGGVINMEKDKFVIYQLAEGSTEVQGLVSILRYSNTFTYYGSPTGWDFRVAYDDVTPDTPVISESWCRIAEVKDLKADEYDYYKEYILEMDINNSNFSRTCTITFIGNAEDGTQIKTPFQFTQQGQEEIVNEGEYANYKGYFMDFEGAVHSVSFITNPRSDVYGDIRLAGDSPVVVSYSENGYLYDPIRTSTCTVKVVSSHYLMNLYSGKAQGTQVILRNEDRDTIEWCGFLQPNLYNQGFTECIEEIEFEASDCLSTLQYLKYEYEYAGNGQPMIVSFKEIVDSIAEKCKLINSYVFTQKLYSNSDESKIFDFKEFYISENNFYSEEGEPWTYQEVLEETCKYFGYVCFQWGDIIYFMDYDKYQSNKTMVGYKYSKDDRWYNRSYITISNPNRITEESYRGTGADISLDDVFNKVTVNCNYYNLEHLLPDLFEDEFLTERNQMTLTTVVNRGQEIGSKTSYIVYDHKNIKSHFYKPIVGEYSHEIEVQPTEDDFNSKSFFKDFVGANIVDMYYLNYSDLNGKTFESKEWEKYLMISQLNRPWCKGPIVGEYDTTKYWENYNFPIMEFTQIPQLFIDNHKEVYESNTTTGGRVPATGGRVPSTRAGFGTSSSTPNSRPSINTNKSEHYFLIRAEAAFTPHFSEAYVPENVDETGFGKWSNSEYVGHYFDRIANTTKKEQNFAPKLTFYLEIPTAGWWNGSKWVDYETWFEVPLEELHYSDQLWYTWKNTQNKVQTNLFLGKSGYKIQLPEDMESTAFMQFKIGMPKRFAHVSGGDDNGEAGNAYCFIKNLEVDIVSRNTALLKDEDIVYENVIDDNNVVDGPEIDLKITSDNNITYSFSTVSTKYGEDMINTTNFRFYDLEGELILPEEGIVERYVKQYSTPTLKENMTVDMTFTPAQMVTDTYWNKNFVITSQEIDYQMCRQEITLLEKK